MRRIGRPLRLASPTKRPVTPEPATTPASRRVLVPLLPQSRSRRGIAQPAQSDARDRDVVAERGNVDAERAQHARRGVHVGRAEDATARATSPSASALQISERCEIDLSPGTTQLAGDVEGRRAHRSHPSSAVATSVFSSRYFTITGVWSAIPCSFAPARSRPVARRAPPPRRTESRAGRSRRRAGSARARGRRRECRA